VTVISVVVVVVCNRLNGANGRVSTLRASLAVDPLEFTAFTVTLRDVPGSRAIKVADVEVLELGIIGVVPKA
jgi:hypothetical protein